MKDDDMKKWEVVYSEWAAGWVVRTTHYENGLIYDDYPDCVDNTDGLVVNSYRTNGEATVVMNELRNKSDG